ncbi:MAG: tetratricopeptide repeat protein [Chloroflexi bacterium]|nr:tetratricopeptide repeat protein [Chloroflexota bacterium]
MTLYQAEYKSKIRREKTREAIALAMENRWEEAAAVNRAILDMFPDDVEAYNRLGKAHLESGNYDEALVAFRKTLELSPSNAIARKNLDRLGVLRREQQQPKRAQKVKPEQFLEESGKTGTAVLEQTAEREVIAKLTPGDALTLRPNGRRLEVFDADGEPLGIVPSRMASRLLRLAKGGNRYEAAVTHVQGSEVTILVRETYQHPSQRGVSSFPTRADQFHSYLPAAVQELDLMDEEDEEIEAAFNSEWEEENGEEGEEFPRAPFAREPAMEEEEEEA